MSHLRLGATVNNPVSTVVNKVAPEKVQHTLHQEHTRFIIFTGVIQKYRFLSLIMVFRL
jgi:hypothetical protein